MHCQEMDQIKLLDGRFGISGMPGTPPGFPTAVTSFKSQAINHDCDMSKNHGIDSSSLVRMNVNLHEPVVLNDAKHFNRIKRL